VFPGVLISDGGLGRPPRRLSDIDRSRLSDRLDAARGVDEIPSNHPFTLRRQVHCGFSGEHSSPRPQLKCSYPAAKFRDRRNEVQARPHGPLGIVLVRNWGAPDGHHGVPDELLHDAAIAGDDLAGGIEVLREEFPYLLGVLCLGQGGESDKVGEEYRDEAAFCVRC
jgi:hypothetical protein